MPMIVHFDIATDEPERAKKFYEGLFDWKMVSPPGMADYYLIETQGLKGEKGAGGGLGKRGEPGQRITAYFGVKSIEEATAKCAKLGGKVLQSKLGVPGFGYLANCLDTEGNSFGLWQDDPNAKFQGPSQGPSIEVDPVYG